MQTRTRFLGATSVRLLSALVLLGGVAALLATGLIPWRSPTRSQAAGGPPQIISPGDVTISQPTAGAKVLVTAPSTSLSGTISDIFARNLTLDGPNAAWVAGTYTSSTNTGDIKITGAAGDLIELRVYEPSVSPNEDVALVGYVPVPTDSASPDYNPLLITVDSTFEVSLAAKSVFDQSWPVTAELGLFGQAFTDSAVLTSTNNAYNTNTPTLTISANSGDRAVLRLTDNYGNRTDLHFIVDTAVGATTFDPFPTIATYRPAGSYAASERTGQAAVAGSGVLLHGLTFLTQHNLLSLRGRTLDPSVELYYRSAMSYDGPVGMGWDWSLDSRIERVGGAGSYNWWPGNGLVHEGISSSASPAGIFLEFSVSGSSYLLRAASGAELSFEISTGLLERITDEHGGSLELTRDSLGRVVSLEDDKGRKTRFSWFHTGRLAAVTDFGARTTRLDYTDDRELQYVTRPDGSVLEWGYSGGLLTEIWSAREAAGTARKVLHNEYQSGVLHKQRDLYSMYLGNATTGSPTIFAVSPTGGPTAPSQTGVTVVRSTDGQGAVTDYGVGDTNGELRILRRHYNLDRRSANGYPSHTNPDPDWVDHLYELSPDNLLPTRAAKRHSGQTAQYPDLEIQEWTYLSPQDTNPRARARLLTFAQKGDGTGTALTTTYEYPTSGAIYWPKSMTDAGGRVTNVQYSLTGQLLRRSVDDVGYDFATPPATYDIVTEYEYDDGLLTKVWNPNRLHDFPSSPQPSTQRVYFTSGLWEGWLERVDTLTSSGGVALSTSYEYDLFGNVTRVTNQAGEVTDYTYDLLDRQVEESYSVTLTRPGAPTTPVVQKRRNVYAGDELVEVQGLYRDDFGVVHDVDGNSGAESLIRLSRSETIESTATTGVTRVSRRSLEFSAGEPDGIGEESESRTIYDSNGNAVSHREFFASGSTDYTETTSVYDSLGQLLRSTVDSQSAAPDQDTWYAYDIYESSGKRLTHRYESGWGEPERARYDLYGRPESRWTTKVELGTTSDATPITRFGFYRTDTKYGTNGQRVDEASEVEEYALVGETPTWDGSTYELISRERSYHDEAGRQNRSETLRENGTTPTYTETRSELRPGGQVAKSYPATVNSEVHVQVTTRDSLDRVIAVEQKVGPSLQTITANLTEYETSGRVKKTTRVLWDEKETASYEYETEYVYDERGRVTTTTDLGQTVPTPSPAITPIEHRVAYDGLGRQTYSATWQGSTIGLVDLRTVDLGGREVEAKRGRGPEPLALCSRVTSEYDRKGRMLSRTEWDDIPPPGEESRVTSYTYDGADRQVGVALPLYTSVGSARTVSVAHSLSGSKEVVATTDPNGVTRTVTYNEKGQPLTEAVTVPSGVTHITGATAVEYLYAGSSGCGCSASGQAVEVRTMGGLKDTKVKRTYDLQGRILSEEVSVEATPAWETHTTTFVYDAIGRLSNIMYPPVGTSSPTSQQLQYLYRPDGRLAQLQQLEGAAYDDLVVYSHRGSTQVHTQVIDNLPSPAVEIVQGAMGRDPFGRSGDVGWEHQSQTVLSEAIERDLHGLVTERTRNDGRVSTFSYEGDNWLASEAWEEANPYYPSSASCSVSYAQVRTLNGYGELIGVEETVSNPDHAPSDPNQPACPWLPAGDVPRVGSWTLNRNGAGLVTSVVGDATFLARYGRATYRDRRFSLRIEHFRANENDPPSTYSTYDLAGNETSETTNVYLEFAPYEHALPPLTCLWAVYDTITTDHQFDAWGRPTTSTRDIHRARSEPGNGSSVPGCNPQEPIPPMDSDDFLTVTDRVYDGYGRLVYRAENGDKVPWIDPETYVDPSTWTRGEYPTTWPPVSPELSYTESAEEYRYAFLAGNVIAETRTDHAGDELTELFRNPVTGQPEKGARRDVADGSTVNQHTFLTGALRPGQVVGSNAGAAASSGEANEWCFGLSLPSECGLLVPLLCGGFEPQEYDKAWDLDGGVCLTPPPVENKCGKDVTTHLIAAMQQLNTNFFAKTFAERSKACRALGSVNGWDISELAFSGGKKQLYVDEEENCGLGSGKGNCEETVTVNGLCYLAEEVNYFLFGYGLRLCANASADLRPNSPKPPEVGLTSYGTDRLNQKANDLIDTYRLSKYAKAAIDETRYGGPEGHAEMHKPNIEGRRAWARAGIMAQLQAPEVQISGCPPCSAPFGQMTGYFGDKNNAPERHDMDNRVERSQQDDYNGRGAGLEGSQRLGGAKVPKASTVDFDVGG